MNQAVPPESRTMVLENGPLRFTTTVFEPAAPARAVVLMLHGFPDVPRTFFGLAPALTAAGYRVVVPVMRGYETSSLPPDDDFMLAALAGDVAAWLDQPPLQGLPVHLVGHDWGALTTYAAAALVGERFVSCTALAIPPVGGFIRSALFHVPGQVPRFWYQYLFLPPGIAGWHLAGNDFSLVERLWQDWSPGLAPPRDILEEVRNRFREPAVARAMVRYYRGLYAFHQPRRWRTEKLIRRPIAAPMLILNGLEDGCVDARMFPHNIRRNRFPRGVQHVTLESCGHWLHLECPERVLDLLLAHFRQTSLEETA